jgi:hypothetical protein
MKKVLCFFVLVLLATLALVPEIEGGPIRRFFARVRAHRQARIAAYYSEPEQQMPAPAQFFYSDTVASVAPQASKNAGCACTPEANCGCFDGAPCTCAISMPVYQPVAYYQPMAYQPRMLYSCSGGG